jgi:hypothetical protein
MTAAGVTRWSRASMAASAVFLVGWQVAAVAGLPRRTLVALALPGFVYHAVFGKGASLVPTYFERTLAVPWVGAVQLPLTATGALALALAPVVDAPIPLDAVGGVLWALGAASFLAVLAWTLRGNLTGAATGTSAQKADRRRVDRIANAAVPVVLAYVLVGAYEQAAVAAGLPSLLGQGFAGASHLLAAGGAALLVFAVGFRLFPRFLVAHPPFALVVTVLPAGAVGPALVASNVYGGPLLPLGAGLESVAVAGFALAYVALFTRSDRRRVGFYAVLAGGAAGTVGVLLGLHVAFAGPDAAVAAVHRRLNLLGFLGLTIVGAAYQFYPPNVGTWPGTNDRTALASVALVAAGLALDVGTLGLPLPAWAGPLLALAGSLLYAYLFAGALLGRR